MTREDIWSILRSNLAKSSQNHHVSAFLCPQTLHHGLLGHCTRHEAQGSLLLESAAFPGAHTCWTATPASWFILSYGCTSCAAVVWGGLFCTASSQNSYRGLIVCMLWAWGAHSPWNGFSGAQQCHLRWRRHSGPCLTRDYTKQALFYKRIVWGHSKGEGELFHNSWKAGSGSHREKGEVWGTLGKV